MHVAITGASSGIGEALAREMARAGARVTVVARRRELLDKLAAEINGRAVAADLSDAARMIDWVADAEQAHGPIDVLVNNAGMQNTGRFASSSEAVGLQLLATNLIAPLRLMRHVLPGMLERKRGTIVNVASVAALVPPPLQTWYGASKAGLGGFSEALRGELRGSGVQVITVYPGPVRTALGEAGWAAFGGKKGLIRILPEGSPEELARRIRAAVERGRARIIYPRFYAATRMFPVIARWATDLGAPRPSD
jgi:short-subunit dehydrogenase